MRRKIFLTLFLLSALAAVIALAVLNYPYSSGSKSGTLVKLSKKGWLFKTYEGSLDLGQGDKTPWSFSVRDEKLGEEMGRKIGQHVNVKFQELLTPLYYETKYNITSFEVALIITPEAKTVLCRLIDVLRTYPHLVDQIRPVLDRDDPELLKVIRKECQNLVN